MPLHISGAGSTTIDVAQDTLPPVVPKFAVKAYVLPEAAADGVICTRTAVPRPTFTSL